MKTKINIILCFLVMAALSLTGCKQNAESKADKNIQNAISGLVFPQTLKNGTKVLNITYSNKTLVYTVELDKAQLDAIDVNTQRAKTLNDFKSDLTTRNLYLNAVKAGATLKYNFVNGSDSVSFFYTPQELK